MRTLILPAILLPAAALLLAFAQDPSPAGPAVGKPAAAFALNDHRGERIAVGGKAERWTVLAFYPKAATPG